MKISTDLIVLRDRETGNFLQELKNTPNSLATHASFVSEIRGALTMPFESYIEQKQSIKAMAKMHDCEIIRVKTEHQLSYPNGGEVLPVEKKNDNFFDLLKAYMEG